MFDELFAAWRIRLRGRLTADDELLIKALERELAGVVATRNRLVHDVWMGPLDESQPLVAQRWREDGTGALPEPRTFIPEDLLAQAYRVRDLGWMLNSMMFQTQPPYSAKFHVVASAIQRRS